MKIRTIPLQWMVIWNVVLTVSLLVSFGTNAVLVQAANDPPVQVFTANADDSGGTGGGSAASRLIPTTAPVNLLGIPFSVSTSHKHVCMVTANADMFLGNTTAAGYYTFNLRIDSTSATVNSTRTVGMNGNVNGAANAEVTTLETFVDVSGGPHSVTMTGRKFSSGAPDATVDRVSIIVVCMKKLI